ncbi:MAG: cytochrome c biogenesis protein CcsA [Ignavibacteriae bacterium]|nr:cytochrome c biogenesis protein CcsA [Ignavibacteriota bacterium]
MLGQALVLFAFISSLISGVSYYLNHKRGDIVNLNVARYSYHAAVISVMGFCSFLIYLILTHQFQYTYVWNYSSTDLPTPLLISTFYAGQEGSFSLWALYTAIIGVVLMGYASRRNYESSVMFVWNWILAFLLLMLIVKNPFENIWEAFPKEIIQTGPIPPTVTNFLWLDEVKGIWAQIPQEGRSLNPLLQNYWMVIHPQILFSGFTAMAIPFVFAIAGLLKRDYQGWVRIAKPWSVFAATALGTGIILGGYWAYETLGWGGYWGWDPVENSSLIPWLVCIGLIHTMMSQARSGAFVKTNFVLSILAYMLVLYSTFLTRSGVLGETSVHSFVDPGMYAYWLLLSVIFLFGGTGFYLLLSRMKEMPNVKIEHSIYSREFALFLGAYAICLSALFIVIGTSAPIITQILQGKSSAVDTSFYVKTTLPIGIAVSFLAGFGQLLWWKNSNKNKIIQGLILPLILSVLFTVVMVLIGVTEIQVLLFLFTAGFALFVNLIIGFQIFKGDPKYSGGALSHIGLAFLFLGFVSSEGFDRMETVSLERGKPLQVFSDYQLTYVGMKNVDAERYGFMVDVEHGKEKFTVMPVMHYSNYTQNVLRHPDVKNMYTKDFYIAPMSLEESDGKQESTISLLKGETKNLQGIQVKFIDYDFSNMDKTKMLEGGGFSIGAMLEIRSGEKVEQLMPLMKNDGGQVNYIPVKSTFADIELKINKLQPNREDPTKSRVELSFVLPNGNSQSVKLETLVVEASIKPLINLVWVGTITLLVGFIITIVRRSQETRLKSQV